MKRGPRFTDLQMHQANPVETKRFLLGMSVIVARVERQQFLAGTNTSRTGISVPHAAMLAPQSRTCTPGADSGVSAGYRC